MVYSVIGRHKSGANVVGYVLRDESTGVMSLKDRDTTYKLALDKQIINAKAQVYKGTVVMKGTIDRLSDLPLYDEAMQPILEFTGKPEVRCNKITGKVLQGKSIVKYRVTYMVNDIPIESGLLDKDVVIELARNGMIDNARVQKSNGVDILRGTSSRRLSSIPVVGRI